MATMIGIACLVTGTTLVLASISVHLLNITRKRPTSDELWGVHHDPMWG